MRLNIVSRDQVGASARGRGVASAWEPWLGSTGPFSLLALPPPRRLVEGRGAAVGSRANFPAAHSLQVWVTHAPPDLSQPSPAVGHPMADMDRGTEIPDGGVQGVCVQGCVCSAGSQCPGCDGCGGPR